MSFNSLDLPDFILQAVEKLSYTCPTPIQQQAIPVILSGHDLMAEAQTGTGKTAAFALPVIKQFNEREAKKKKYSVEILTLVPTRELALQVAAAFKAYAKYSPKDFKVISLIGGENIKQQIRSLRMGADAVVATPGRLLELIKLQEIRLVELKTLILDEADKMLDLGFKEELDSLLNALPKTRQNLLFSATLPQKVTDLSKDILTDPEHISVTPSQENINAISQRLIEVNREKRRALLQHLIQTEEWDYALVFVASKKAARNLSAKLRNSGIAAEELHGNLTQEERIRVFKAFKNKEIKILIATDLASRGLDIEKLSYVVNYDLPRSPKGYIHRIGRTGRAGETGKAVTFIGHEDQDHFLLIEKRCGITLEREQIEGFELSGEAPIKPKGKAPVKGKRKSKKDKLREQAATAQSSECSSASD